VVHSQISELPPFGIAVLPISGALPAGAARWSVCAGARSVCGGRLPVLGRGRDCG